MKLTHPAIRNGLVVLLLFCCNTILAQPLNGNYTIGGASPDYATLKLAINALNTRGVNDVVVFNIRDGNYSGSNWQGQINTINGASASNTITFQSQSNDRTKVVLSASGSSSKNYIIKFKDASYITIKDLTLKNTASTYGCDIRFEGASSYNVIENCVLTGHTGNSSSTNKCRVYGTSLSGSSNDTFRNNLFERGSYGIYFRGNNTSATSNGHVFTNNTFEQNYSYAIYAYYLGDIEFSKNYVHRTGSGTYNGAYFYYTRNNMLIDSNEFDVNTTSTTYGIKCERANYSSNNSSAYVAITNNKLNFVSKTNNCYPTYIRYGRYNYVAKNDINLNSTSTSGNVYVYMMYSSYNSRAHKNNVNIDKAGGRAYVYTLYAGNDDTVSENNIEVLGNTYIYNYLAYSCIGQYTVNNDVHLKTNNRTIYGTYCGYDNGIFANNKVYHESNTGTVTGLLMDYANGTKFYNNLVVTKTNGTNYSVKAYRVYPGTRFFNNTIYTSGTGTNNYNLYCDNNNSSYGFNSYNNIFYKEDTKGYNCYFRAATNVKSDHNLYYRPAGNIFNGVKTADNLHKWRDETGLDQNSIFYDVPFTDAANFDFTISANEPAAWSVNARAIHDSTRYTDYAGTAVPLFVTDGVPDIGAFEVSPTVDPPNAIASPANPVANSTQVFTFGQDTVLTMDWGATVPTTYTVQQFAGVKATPVPAGLERMFFYTKGTPSSWEHTCKANVHYMDPWIGDTPSETDAVMARRSNNGAWEGYNFTDAFRDSFNNVVSTQAALDSVGSYTVVRNGRIGIRCVYPPTGIRVSKITAFSADLDWDAIYNPLGYQVIVKKSNTPPTDAEWGGSSFPVSNNVAVGSLDEDTKYYVFIRNVCGIKDTSDYTLDSFTTIITCHEPVVSSVDISYSRAVVHWDNIKTAIGYEVALTKSPTPPSAGTNIKRLEYLFSNIDEGTEYYAHVRANCSTIYEKSDWTTVPLKTWGVSVDDVNASKSGMRLYPNPVSNVMMVSFNGDVVSGNVTVMNMAGKQLISQTVNSNEVTVNVSSLPAGMYIVQYNNEGRREQMKFTKQ